MGLFDTKGDDGENEDDALALGIATGTTSGVFNDGPEADAEGASEEESGEGPGEMLE